MATEDDFEQMEREGALLAALDFDPEVACMASTRMSCPNPAVYYVRCRACDYPQPRCYQCTFKLRLLGQLTKLPAQCRICKAIGATLDDIMIVVPIKGNRS